MEPLTFFEAVGALMAAGATLLGGHHAIEHRKAKNGMSNGAGPAVNALHRRMDEIRDRVIEIRTQQKALNEAHLGAAAIDPDTGHVRWWCQAKSLSDPIERLEKTIDRLPEELARAIQLECPMSREKL